jgi:transposase
MKKFNYYVGIDVSKLTLDVTVLYESDIPKTVYYKTCTERSRSIENTEKSITQFVKRKLSDYAPEQILFCFEHTGIYSLPLVYCLSEHKLSYWQVPAAVGERSRTIEIRRSKGITRGKTDKIDSKDIAFYAFTHTHKFRPSIMSAKSIQQLRLLFTEREKLVKALALFGTTVENKDFVRKEVFNAVASANRTVIKQLKKTLKDVEKKMLSIIGSDEKLSRQYKLITSIPGVGMQTAIYIIIATKGFDAFENWRQLACYAGVAPFPYQSGTSIHGRTKVHHLADKKLKSLLNLCAIVAIRYDKEIKCYYERKVKEGKHKMLVINNVRCKLLSRVFAVINRDTPFVNTFKFAS